MSNNPFQEITERLDRIETVLSSMPQAVADGNLSISETAEFLRQSTSQIYKLAEEGTLPGSKIGTRWVFQKRDLVNFLNKRRVL